MQRVPAVLFIALGICAFGKLGVTSNINTSAARGRQTFVRVGCYECHGYEAQGGAGPRLAPGPIPLAAISAFVRGTTGDMPAYGEEILSDSDLADIYAFLMSVPPPKSPAIIPALKTLK